MSEVKEPPRKRGLWRNILLALGFSGLAISLLLYFTQTDLSQVFSLLNLWYFLGAIALIVLNWVLEGLRLHTISDALGFKLSFRQGLQIALVGSFFANITPFDSGGEPFQFFLLAKNGVQEGKSAALIMVKGIMSNLARLSLGIGIPLWLALIKASWNLPPGLNIALNVGIAVFAFITAITIIFTWKPQLASKILSWLFSLRFFKRVIPEKTREKLTSRFVKGVEDFHNSVKSFARAKKKDLALIVVYSLLLWLVLLTVPALLLRALGVYSPLPQVLAVGIIFYLAVAYGPTPGSSGIAEAGFATLFYTAQLIPYPLLGAFVVLWRLLTYYLSLIVGGVVSLLSFNKRKH